MMSTGYSACITAPNSLIQSCPPVMTWDPLGLGGDWVAAAEVVATEEIIEAIFTSSHLGHAQRIMQFTATG